MPSLAEFLTTTSSTPVDDVDGIEASLLSVTRLDQRRRFAMHRPLSVLCGSLFSLFRLSMARVESATVLQRSRAAGHESVLEANEGAESGSWWRAASRIEYKPAGKRLGAIAGNAATATEAASGTKVVPVGGSFGVVAVTSAGRASVG